MSGNVDGVARITRKDGEVVWTTRISWGGRTRQQGISLETALRIAEAATNTFPQDLMNLPSGSKVSWEMKHLKPSSKGAGKSANAQKRTSKKSRATGKPKRNTSNAAGKKAGSS